MKNIEFDITKLALKINEEEKIPYAYANILALYAANTFGDKAKEGLALWAQDKLTEDFAVGESTVGHEIQECAGTKLVALFRLDLLDKGYEEIHDMIWFTRYGNGVMDFEAMMKEMLAADEEEDETIEE